MKKLIHSLSTALLLTLSISSFANYYEAPPSSSTRGYASGISEEEMEKCVKLYNQANNLATKIGYTSVDRYSQVSVDDYNDMVSQHSIMIENFNSECAGKSSAKAAEVTRELNSSIR